MSYMGTLRRDLAKLEHEEKRDTEKAFKNKHLIISFFLRFSFSLSWKFWPQLVCKYASFPFLVYMSPNFDKREDEIL